MFLFLWRINFDSNVWKFILFDSILVLYLNALVFVQSISLSALCKAKINKKSTKIVFSAEYLAQLAFWSEELTVWYQAFQKQPRLRLFHAHLVLVCFTFPRLVHSTFTHLPIWSQHKSSHLCLKLQNQIDESNGRSKRGRRRTIASQAVD